MISALAIISIVIGDYADRAEMCRFSWVEDEDRALDESGR